MKALDVLRQQRDSVQQAAERWAEYAQAARKDRTAAPGPETCQRRADEFTAKVATMDRIAKVVEAARAWIASDWGTKDALRQAEYDWMKGHLTDDGWALVQAVAALDAEEVQTAAPQEEGEHP